MKKLFILFFVSTPFLISAQTTYTILDFSTHYNAQIEIEQGFENHEFKKGSFSIVNTTTDKQMLFIESDELIIETDLTTKEKTTSTTLPYDRQNFLIFQDFNFDGLKDIAYMDGRNSCYGGPSYQIYLQEHQAFVYSPEFTRLSYEYCGMFQIAEKTKTIHTMTKSGCCWHQFSEFKVQNNIPIAIKISEESMNPNGILLDYVEKERVNNQMIETKYSTLPDSGFDIQTIFSFQFKNSKKMNLVHAFSNQLYYVFTDKEDKVELFYDEDFIYHKDENTLTFTRKNTRYQISATGITVQTPSKNIPMNADGETIEGELASLLSLTLDNLRVE
ncbi:hypothetical protein Celal_0175 [Cellulophaga algicola DSM 14237]|uniref:FG-GAP repeat protein n=1 Tax=Cellulophaga algicola (strain DSM 14237 / IC166 / ACAM 630) TaxID=688270 RepID=E6X7T3_CELAD|nr:hypothetical protein [Cellulophaga algicola]ADV47526.1 hypothetical protein Celal_0175 [Cellulophaga algicola DSM 14237]